VSDALPDTLERLLERYPWPHDDLSGGRPLEFFWRYTIAAPVAHLWPHVADTSRVNRALGYDTMQFEERDDGVRLGRAKHGGFLHEWLEEPWEWVAERRMTLKRRYSRGFGKTMRGIFLLEPIDAETTRLVIYFGWIPGNQWWKRWVLRFGFGGEGKAFGRFFDNVAAEVRDRPVVRLAAAATKPPPLAPEGAAALARAVKRLKGDGHDPVLVDRLADTIVTSDDMELDRIHVRRLARAWGVDERALLKVCLHATRAGLLALSWDVVCPYCRGLREELERLADLSASSSCTVCDENFSTAHPNVIEISFRVASAVRDVPKLLYCSAEPAFKKHILVQQSVAPGAEVTVPTPLGVGEYRVRERGAGFGPALRVVENASAEAFLVASQLPASDSDGVTAGPRPVLKVSNPTDATATLMVEEPTWADDVLRPDDILTFPDFRDLFSGEYLRDELQLSVGVQTILFTDMVGSTRFYASRGDAEAYVAVNRHFKEVFDAVRQHEGAVVKTIGDAVMAVFGRTVDAVRTARLIHHRFGPEHPEGIRLRVSVHAGPVIAAPYNDGLDFFGRTVNLAAKLQACAEAGQVALSPEAMAAASVEGELSGESVTTVPFELKATGQVLDVARWDVNP